MIAGERTRPISSVNGCVGVVPTKPSERAKPNVGYSLSIARGWLVSSVLVSTPCAMNWPRTTVSSPLCVVRPSLASVAQSTVPQSAKLPVCWKTVGCVGLIVQALRLPLPAVPSALSLMALGAQFTKAVSLPLAHSALMSK